MGDSGEVVMSLELIRGCTILEGGYNFSCPGLGPGCVVIGISLKHLLVTEACSQHPDQLLL